MCSSVNCYFPNSLHLHLDFCFPLALIWNHLPYCVHTKKRAYGKCLEMAEQDLELLFFLVVCVNVVQVSVATFVRRMLMFSISVDLVQCSVLTEHAPYSDVSWCCVQVLARVWLVLLPAVQYASEL